SIRQALQNAACVHRAPASPGSHAARPSQSGPGLRQGRRARHTKRATFWALAPRSLLRSGPLIENGSISVLHALTESGLSYMPDIPAALTLGRPRYGSVQVSK